MIRTFKCVLFQLILTGFCCVLLLYHTVITLNLEQEDILWKYLSFWWAYSTALVPKPSDWYTKYKSSFWGGHEKTKHKRKVSKTTFPSTLPSFIISNIFPILWVCSKGCKGSYTQTSFKIHGWFMYSKWHYWGSPVAAEPGVHLC